MAGDAPGDLSDLRQKVFAFFKLINSTLVSAKKSIIKINPKYFNNRKE